MNNPHVLIIGGGLAGLYCALNVAPAATVTLVMSDADDCSTRRAQGGIAAAVGHGDSPSRHAADTIRVGAGLCRRPIVHLVAREARRHIERLRALHVEFCTTPDRSLDLALEGGHTARRVVHVDDMTGAAVHAAARAAVDANAAICVVSDAHALELVIDTNDGPRRCVGATVFRQGSGATEFFSADAVVIATGGTGGLYRDSTNTRETIGSGIALAWRAGAEVANLEFVQFHPTLLAVPGAAGFLLSEALRGEGGILRRADMTPLMDDIHPLKSLAPRDVVARAIEAEHAAGRTPVWLDMRAVDAAVIEQRFPGIHAHCLSLGVDMRRQPLPVAVGAHYQCGGVNVDSDGQTSLRGLFAVGEAACTGLHGACRLASNSLLEALVFAERVAACAVVQPRSGHEPKRPEPFACGREPADAAMLDALRARIHDVMSDNVGVVRDDASLLRAVEELTMIESEVGQLVESHLLDTALARLRDAALVARLIAVSARSRHESRGVHFNRDWPSLAAVAAETKMRRGA